MQLTFTPPSKQPTSQCLSLSLRVSNQSPLFPEAQFSHIRLFKVLLKAHSEHVGREGQASLSYLHGGSRRGGIHSQQINTSSKNALFLISEFHTCILLSRMKHTEVVRLILLSSLPTTLRQHTLKKKNLYGGLMFILESGIFIVFMCACYITSIVSNSFQHHGLYRRPG